MEINGEYVSWRKVANMKKAKAKAMQTIRYVGPDSGSPFSRAIKSRATYQRANLTRRVIRGNCYPSWLTRAQKAQIADIYRQADLLTLETGVLHHVDHIVPLKGETVSGLHVPWNLKPMKALENQSKGNRFWPDMWL